MLTAGLPPLLTAGLDAGAGVVWYTLKESHHVVPPWLRARLFSSSAQRDAAGAGGEASDHHLVQKMRTDPAFEKQVLKVRGAGYMQGGCCCSIVIRRCLREIRAACACVRARARVCVCVAACGRAGVRVGVLGSGGGQAAKAAGGDCKVMLDMGWKAATKGKDTDLGRALIALSKIGGTKAYLAARKRKR
jgi:hypothetical protein